LGTVTRQRKLSSRVAQNQRLRDSGNYPAELRKIYALCFGEAELPSYGMLGKVAKAVGGAGRLAEIMWQLSAKPPTGDVMAYILAAYGPKRRRGKRTAQQRQGELQNAVAEFLGED